jgi:hypothetical protein
MFAAGLCPQACTKENPACHFMDFICVCFSDSYKFLCKLAVPRVTLLLLRLLVKIPDILLLALLKILGLRAFVLQEWYLQPLLHAHVHVSCKHG